MIDALELAHKAYISYNSLRFSKAMELANAAIALDASVYAYHVKGCILQQQEKYLEAIKAYSLGLDVNPMDISCLKGITQSCFLMQDYSKALIWAQTWLNYLGPSKAIEFYEKSSSLKMEDETLREMANVYLELLDYDNAISVMNQAIEYVKNKKNLKSRISQDNPLNKIALARVYESMQNIKKALETVDLILETNKNDITALEYHGIYNYKLGNIDKAALAFQNILKIDQNNLNAMNQLSIYYLDIKKYLLASILLEKIIQSNPKEQQNLLNMAKCQHFLNRKISSLHYLNECIAVGHNSDAESLRQIVLQDLQID